MKPKYNQSNPRNHVLGASIAIVVCLSGSAMAQTQVLWNGSVSTAWNTGANWDGGAVPTKTPGNNHAVINTNTPNIATISEGIIPPTDIIVGLAATGRLDHVAGDASTGGGNWMFVGRNGGTGVFNLADTAATGGTHTGFGVGSGSMNVNNAALHIGGFEGSGSNGTVNVNTTGTLTIGYQLEIGTSTGVGVLNLDNGTITTNNWTEIGNGGGSTGTLNMSGGTFSKQGNEHMIVGANGATGYANVSGGTINVNNEFWVGNNGGSKGTLNFSGGSINVNSWVAVCRSGATLGTVTMTGGTWTKTGGGNFLIADGGGTTAVFTQSAGTVTSNNTVIVGNNGNGTLDISGGSMTSGNEFFIGQGGSSTASVMKLSSSGTVTSQNWVVVGRGGGKGTVEMTGGTWNKNTSDSNFIIASNTGSVGVVNMSGGTINVPDSGPIDRGITWLGENDNSQGTLNMSGTAQFNTERFVLGVSGAAVGTMNLNGGNIQTAHILGGSATANVYFNGTKILATTGSNDFIQNLDVAEIKAGGLLLDSQSFNLVSAQSFTGVGGIQKLGFGSLSLTGANSFSGNIDVIEGKIGLTTAATGSTAATVTLSDDTAFGVTQTVADAAYNVLNANFGAGTTLDMDLGSFAGNSINAPLNVTGSGALTLNGPVTVNVTDNLPVVGIIPLVSYVGGKSGAGSFALGTLPDGVVATFSDNGSNLVSLNVTRVNDAYWTGAVDTNWDIATTANWKDDYAETASTYQNGDPVMFDDRVIAAGPGVSVTLNTTVAPGGSGVTFGNALKNYALTGGGKITGATGLLKQGAGSLDLATTNDYLGATTLSGGTTNVAALANGGLPSAIGASDSSDTNLVLNGGTLNYTGAATTIDRGFTIAGSNSGIGAQNDLTIGGMVSSTGGGLVKTGAGNLTLTNPTISMGAGGQINKITGGTLTLSGAGSQYVSIPGELWVGSIPNSAGHLVLADTTLNVGSWITIGRGTGNTGVVCSLTATNSTLQCNQLSTGFDADLGYNNATQLITLTDTAFTNIGRTALSEKQNDITTMTLAGTSSFTSPQQFQMALNATAVANLIIQDDATMTLTGNWFSIGNDGTGVCTVKNNASLSKTGGDFNISDVGTSNGTLNIQNNATVTADSVVFVGKNNGTTGTVNMDGGTFNTNTYITIGRGAGSTGTFHMNGGTINQTDPNAGIAIGEQGNGTFNFNGGSVNVGGGGFYITTETTTTGVGVANLNGGTLTAKRVTARDGTSGTSTLNFNGGLLKAGPGASLDFISNLDTITVQAGGANIDSNGQTIATGQVLLDGGTGGGLTKTGTGTLQLNASNTYTGATTVNAGSLGGTGSVAGPLVVGAAGTLAPGTSAGTFTAGASTISGTYACEIDGANADKLVSNGTLAVSAATLAITELSAPSAPVYVIASYTGSTPAPFASVTGLPAGYTVVYNHVGNQIALIQTATPYTTWAQSNITAINPGADATPAGDPDGDGTSNIAEFALDGNPLTGASTGKVIGKVASVGGSPALVLTLPVRTGAAFSGTTEQVSDLIDGVIYKIQGSDELATWSLVVSEVTGGDKGIIETGMPPVSSGWEYRTFRSPGTTTGDPADFLRAVIVNP